MAPCQARRFVLDHCLTPRSTTCYGAGMTNHNHYLILSGKSFGPFSPDDVEDMEGTYRHGPMVWRRADTVVGYTYKADIVCPACILSAMRAAGLPVAPVLDTYQVTAAVDSVAADLGIDPEDEYSYDSDNFPKVLFSHQVDDDDMCGRCGVPLED